MRSISLFTIAGIEVAIHPTWFIAFALIAWTFATGLFPRLAPGWSTAEYWIAGSAASALLFVSVLGHELAHSFTARALGLPVHGITLFLFGGVSRIGGEIRKARIEFMVSFAGPAASMLIGALCLVASIQYRGGPGEESLAVTIIYVLGYMNLFIGAFNLLPGHPLDGGRVLRSMVWGATGNAVLAARVSTMSGRVIAFGMMALGAFWLIQGDSIGGLWMILLAVFLLGSASQESRSNQPIMDSGATVEAATVLTRGSAEHDETLDAVARRHLWDGDQSAVPVSRSGELIGFLDQLDISRFASVDWPNITVGPLVEPRGFEIAELDDSARSVLMKLSAGGRRAAAVFDGPRFVGVATVATLAAVISGTQPET